MEKITFSVLIVKKISLKDVRNMFFVCFENDHHPFYEERGTPIMSKRGGLLGTAKRVRSSSALTFGSITSFLVLCMNNTQ